MELPVITVTVDIVVLTIVDAHPQVALVERGIPPYEGKQALPDGLVLSGESVMDVTQRRLVEETGLDLDATHLKQLVTSGEPGRNPRGRVASVAHPALAASPDGLTPGSDTSGARWCPVDDLPSLASDHDKILRTGIERTRTKLEYTTVAARFCGFKFTTIELRQVYETIWGARVDPRSFSRKVLGSRGFVIECGTHSGDRERSITLYRAGAVDSLHPPITRRG